MVSLPEMPERYEIRVLEPSHIDWAKAIVTHTNIFHSPVWPTLYPENLVARAYRCFNAADYLVRHQVESGHSLGVFDKEYPYRREESKATGGKLYWELQDESVDGAALLEQMDFPLVSIALSYDGFNHLDMGKMADLLACLPAYGDFYRVLGGRDKRDPASWQPKAPGEVLMRNATSTRHDYEGRGLMKNMARYLMRTTEAKGFRGIQIECLADAVNHVWSNPPAPFRSDVVAEFNCWDYEEKTDDGETAYPFRPAKQQGTKVYCHLK